MSFRDWLVKKLQEPYAAQDIEKVEDLENNFMAITPVKSTKILVVAVTDNLIIKYADVYDLLWNGPQSPDMVVSRSAAKWHGCAIDYLYRLRVGWGGLGEIFLALHTTDYETIQKREYNFVEQGLLQHSRVVRLERVYDRVFKVYRSGVLKPLVVTLINSYELSADEVRNAIKNYGKFDLILKTNPNGYPTGNAYAVAKEAGVEILLWRDLLSRLNKK